MRIHIGTGSRRAEMRLKEKLSSKFKSWTSLWGWKILPLKTEVLNGILSDKIFSENLMSFPQCRGSRSGSDAFMTPGSGIQIRDGEKNPDPGCTSRILFLRTSYQFFELIILWCISGSGILSILDPEWKSGIRDKHPGSAALLFPGSSDVWISQYGIYMVQIKKKSVITLLSTTLKRMSIKLIVSACRNTSICWTIRS